MALNAVSPSGAAVAAKSAPSAATGTAGQAGSSAQQDFDKLLASMRATSDAASVAKTGAGEDATEDRFLKLLVAQMKNQDPLNPLDNETFVAQLAQFSTVSGITSTNDKLDALSRLTASNVRTGALQWIGRSVTGPAGESGTVASVAIAEDNSLSLTLGTGATLSAAEVRHMS